MDLDIDVDALEGVALDGWRAVEEDRLGDWVLRASGGWTSRGNSVLTLGDPGLPPADALAVVTRWYAARGLPPRLCLITDVNGTPRRPELAALVQELGYAAAQPTLTMVASCAQLPSLDPQSPPVTADAALTPEWLAALAAARPVQPGVTEAILTGSAGQLFLSVPGLAPGAGPRAIARMSIAPGWAGIQAMWVDPGHRRQGLATAVVAAVAQLGREHHMPRAWLQVERANEVARAAYGHMGFRAHHGHVYTGPS